MNKLVDVVGPGLFSKSHIIYIILVTIFLAFISIMCFLFVKKETTKEKIIKVLGIILLISIIANRISLALFNDGSKVHEVNFNFKYLFPDTFCGVSSLILAINILLNKKDSMILHGIYIFCLMGGFSNIVLPTYLNTQYWYDLRTITGLLHHTISLLTIILLIIFNYFNPRMNRWYAFPITLCIYMTYGLIIYEGLNIEAMQIKDPFVLSLPILTSWYSTFLLQIIVEFIIIILFERFKYKNSFKNIFSKNNLWPFESFKTPLIKNK